MDINLPRPRRRVSPVLFGLALLAFLLPFATVSCDGASTRFTAAQLVTHTVPDGGRPESDSGSCGCRDISDAVENHDSWIVLIALVAGVSGLVLTCRGVARGPGWIALAGTLTVAYLPFSAVFAEVHLHAGYWLMLGSFAAAWLLHVALTLRRNVRWR
jgi:hypothetical protein